MSNLQVAILNHCTRHAQRMLSARCLLCDAAAEAGTTLCAPCRADLPVCSRPRCSVCALPLPAPGLCGSCLAAPPAFDATTAACDYAWPVDRLIHALKYAGNLACAATLAELMVPAVRAARRPDLLVPVPLSPDRLAGRGFNQALELARLLGRSLEIPVAPAACERRRHTAPQAGLARATRAANVRRAFSCPSPLDGHVVAVVDDVMTTGATLHEVAAALKAAGAAQVLAWVAARTPP